MALISIANLDRVISAYEFVSGQYASGELADQGPSNVPLLNVGAAPTFNDGSTIRNGHVGSEPGHECLDFQDLEGQYFERRNPFLPRGSIITICNVRMNSKFAYMADFSDDGTPIGYANDDHSALAPTGLWTDGDSRYQCAFSSSFRTGAKGVGSANVTAPTNTWMVCIASWDLENRTMKNRTVHGSPTETVLTASSVMTDTDANNRLVAYQERWMRAAYAPDSIATNFYASIGQMVLLDDPDVHANQDTAVDAYVTAALAAYA